MGTKTITIRDSAYDVLNAKKRENESFSDVILRLSGCSPGNVIDFLDTLSQETRDEIAESVYRAHHELSTLKPRDIVI